MKVAIFASSLLFVLCLTIGPKSLMQISAWGVMIVEYSEGSTLGSAIEDTFSGNRPCDMCISLSKTPSEKPDLLLSQGMILKNMLLFFVDESDAASFRPVGGLISFSDRDVFVPKVFNELETPPPKLG